MKNLHFGAGNIGRGFIAQLLNKSNYKVTFVDINKAVVGELLSRDTYSIKILDNDVEIYEVNNFTALNIAEQKEEIYEEICNVDLITTSIGPNVLPIIAKDIAKGLSKKVESNNTKVLDIIACENMIEGTDFLKNEIFKYLTEEEQNFVNKYVGFPNSAVDRIVPAQKHEDVLLVEVEKFCEWVVEVDKIKLSDNKNIAQVEYVKDLNPFIERKLFTVNTGHAALSYISNYYGVNLVSEGAVDERVRNKFISVLEETSGLLEKKWNFSEVDMTTYREKTIKRFENKLIVDNVARICRTPIRKLGYNERFIKPLRECVELSLPYNNILEICAYILKYNSAEDEQSVKLQQLIAYKGVAEALEEVTEYHNKEVIEAIVSIYNEL